MAPRILLVVAVILLAVFLGDGGFSRSIVHGFGWRIGREAAHAFLRPGRW
jgi:hypothetical protein